MEDQHSAKSSGLVMNGAADAESHDSQDSYITKKERVLTHIALLLYKWKEGLWSQSLVLSSFLFFVDVEMLVHLPQDLEPQ